MESAQNKRAFMESAGTDVVKKGVSGWSEARSAEGCVIEVTYQVDFTLGECHEVQHEMSNGCLDGGLKGLLSIVSSYLHYSHSPSTLLSDLLKGFWQK